MCMVLKQVYNSQFQLESLCTRRPEAMFEVKAKTLPRVAFGDFPERSSDLLLATRVVQTGVLYTTTLRVL